jgi:hypothetical protein
MATTFWRKYESIVNYVREYSGYPQYWRPVEFLSDKMEEIAKKRGDPVLSTYNPDKE